MNRWPMIVGIVLSLAATSLDDEIIQNMDFLSSMEMVQDEETYKVVQEENFEELEAEKVSDHEKDN